MLKKASTSLKVALKDSDKDIYLPDEPEKRASLDEYNEYCHELLNTVQESPYSELPTIKEESSMLSEILDNQIDCYDQSIKNYQIQIPDILQISGIGYRKILCWSTFWN